MVSGEGPAISLGRGRQLRDLARVGDAAGRARAVELTERRHLAAVGIRSVQPTAFISVTYSLLIGMLPPLEPVLPMLPPFAQELSLLPICGVPLASTLITCPVFR